MQYTEPVRGGGEKIVLKDFNVRTQGEQYKKLQGQLVSVHVGIWVDPESRKPGLYIPDGTLPVALQKRVAAAA